jgi:hypothetical protein
MLRRCASLLLMVCFLALGSGYALYLHEQQHAREDAAEAAACKAAGLPARDHPDHDDNNCPVHAQLHMLMVAGTVLPVLLLLGLVVAFLTELLREAPKSHAPLIADCRGPPLLLLSHSM